MLTYFRARAKDFGAQFIRFATGNIASFTANTTNRYMLGGSSDKDSTGANDHTFYVDEIHVVAFAVPADADGAILLTVKKWDASAGAAVTLVTGTAASVSTGDLELLVAGKTERLTIDAAVTEAQRILDFGDSLYIEVVSNSAAIDTQPGAFQCSVLCKMLT